MKYEEILDRNLDEFFWDIVNFRSAHLRAKDNEYKKICGELCNITEETRLRNFFDEKNIIKLTEDDAEIILKYIQLIEDRFVIEMKDLFYVALSIGVKFSKKLEDIIGDED